MLDFFAGSATTAHAALMHSIHNAAVRHILVQLPEAIEDKQYNSIADIAKERIRRAGNQIREELERQFDLEGRENLDLGFKVLKLDQSNFKQWQAPDKEISEEALVEQMELNVDHVLPDASEEDLLYELLIKAGVMPTEQIETIELAGHSLFSVADHSLLVYLGEQIDKPCIDAVLVLAPSEFICLDKAFEGQDQLKANTVKTFQTHNEGREEIDRIDFKTV